MGNRVQPDSITIENLTQNWSETLYYPDTVFVLTVGTGVQNNVPNKWIKATPNPFDGVTRVNILSTKAEKVEIRVTDMSGRACAKYSGLLREGGNFFAVSLTTPQTYVLSVKSASGMHSIKLDNTGHANENRISYVGESNTVVPEKEPKGISSHAFELGDEMRYRGYSNSMVSYIVQKQQFSDEQIVLEFHRPCTITSYHPAQTGSDYMNNGHNGANHGLEAVENGQIYSVTDYDGNEYPVVQIGSQCWLAENMRCTHSPITGTYIVNNSFTHDNFIEYSFGDKMARWYDNDSLTYAPKHYGLLYNWSAAVDVYNTNHAVDTVFPGNRQGICPTGWHVPSKAEWEILLYSTGADTLPGIIASGYDWESNDIAGSPGDYSNPLRNSTGFEAFPIGFCFEFFQYSGSVSHFWSATQVQDSYHSSAYYLRMFHNSKHISMAMNGKYNGFGVRCLRD